MINCQNIFLIIYRSIMENIKVITIIIPRSCMFQDVKDVHFLPVIKLYIFTNISTHQKKYKTQNSICLCVSFFIFDVPFLLLFLPDFLQGL